MIVWMIMKCHMDQSAAPSIPMSIRIRALFSTGDFGSFPCGV